MKLEFCGGGPWDGRIEAVGTHVIEIPARFVRPMGVSPPPISDTTPRPRHVYRRAVITCADKCCEELVMLYEGVR